MTRPLRRVGIGFGRMEIWHDGLGEFSKQVGQHLAARAEQLKEDDGISLHFHLAERWHGMFGDHVEYLPLYFHHRLLHWAPSRFDLWHTLHQHNRFLPPVGTKNKLLTVHDLNFLYSKSTQKTKKYLGRMQRLLNRQTSVAAISRYVRDDVIRHLKPPSEVEVVYNGVSDLTAVARDAVPGVEPERYLLHISRMAATKNVASLLDLAAAMPEQRFVFAGPKSPDADAMRHHILARQLMNAQVLTDISEAQKAWLYANCQGFLFPSLTEGFGLPPLEAMNFGKPVFLSKLTSLPEVGGSVANYFDNFEAASMRTVVRAGLEADADPIKKREIIAHAKKFSWSNCVDSYVGLYRQIISSKVF